MRLQGVEARIEAVLNRQASGSPRARELLAQLANRALVIEVQPTPLKVELRSDGAALTLRHADAETPPADATMAGTPLSLLRLAGPDAEAALRDGSVGITGDAEIAGRFRELLTLLRPDVEEELSRLIGDGPAHALGRFAGGVAGWTRTAARTTARNVYEFLAHEQREIIPRAEAAAFLDGVDRLRESVDRLEARVARLESIAGERAR